MHTYLLDTIILDDLHEVYLCIVLYIVYPGFFLFIEKVAEINWIELNRICLS